MKNLILITDGKHCEFDNIDELRKFIVPEIENISKEELNNYFYEKVFGFSILNNVQIVNSTKGVYGDNYEIENQKIDFRNAIIIDNIDTYILSLCKYNVITLLEEKENRLFTKDIQVELGKDNYIVVNAYANELLLAMVGDEK